MMYQYHSTNNFKHHYKNYVILILKLTISILWFLSILEITVS